ncbi:alpha/beta hydrolase fold domain-containing protein [Luteimonas kalidii]|uniref:Alpha/beta hydrolase fold domain-containing protein n=1 Tax=Luteimonas kalidii TaxID=3042025 RepID=A0ABT6JNX8_9GAMM|nr:alpha/beta hydrolase fold domain-containing protein [Luteimonas kalidii]MDH5832389.1 alpha/beta hydrolase fold domain-containing protein [Luteimonas kalidii]
MTTPPAGRPHDRDDVEPGIRRFMQRMAEGYAAFPPLASLPLDEVRRITARVREQWGSGGPAMAAREDLQADGVRLRILRPADTVPLPVLVYVHGGGWTLFGLETHDRLMREYAARAGVAVLAVDYSLSPEAKYPRALDETVAAIDWLRTHGAAHGLDPERAAIGGDSAGANLAVASQLRLRGAGQRPLSAMLLNYGVYSDAASASWTRYDGPRYMLEAAEMQGFWHNYLDHDAQRRDPLVMPLLADLHGLPPAFVAIPECDILADGNRAMAAALRRHGVQVEMREYRGATHSFLEAVPVSPLADRALDEAAAWLRGIMAR